jgi:hypothetical protein
MASRQPVVYASVLVLAVQFVQVLVPLEVSMP